MGPFDLLRGYAPIAPEQLALNPDAWPQLPPGYGPPPSPPAGFRQPGGAAWPRAEAMKLPDLEGDPVEAVRSALLAGAADFAAMPGGAVERAPEVAIPTPNGTIDLTPAGRDEVPIPAPLPTAPRPSTPPTLDQLTNILYNESASLRGAQLPDARVAMGYVVLNRFAAGMRGGVAPDTLSADEAAAIARGDPAAVKAYADARAAASAVLSGSVEDTTLGAKGYNMRPNDSLRPNASYDSHIPAQQQFGPFDNVAPSGNLPGHGVHLNIYGYGTYRAPTP
jgi:hypothetical protein